MRAELKRFHPIDFENWHYWPDNIQEFGFPAEAIIGKKGGSGEEIFSFWVCTPKWFAKNKMDKPQFVRHYLFVNEYDEETIKLFVTNMVNGVTGKTWNEISERLSRYMFSEFEDYQPYVKK